MFNSEEFENIIENELYGGRRIFESRLVFDNVYKSHQHCVEKFFEDMLRIVLKKNDFKIECVHNSDPNRTSYIVTEI